MLEVIRVVTGYLKENCYIIHNGIDCLVVDPGDDQKKILTEINSRGLHVKGILITHYHFDHVGCLETFKEIYNQQPGCFMLDHTGLRHFIPRC